MALGRILGKVSTGRFSFKIEGDARKFDYLKVPHSEAGNVLAQIYEIQHTREGTIADCVVIGYRDSANILKGLRYPFEPGCEVVYADDEFVTNILGLDSSKNAAYIGVLDGRENLKVYMDLNKLITKHVFVTGKSGSGKSYSVAVILEELLENKVPMVIIDPHGEYSALSYPSAEKDKLKKAGIDTKGYLRQIQEFSPDIEANPNAKPLRLNSKNLTPTELVQMLPAKLSSSQLGVLYSALKNLGGNANFNELIFELEVTEESSSKWTLIHMLEYIKKLNLLSENPTLPAELVQKDKCSVINLRGIPPEVQEVIVYKIVHDLFDERKKNNIPPFFLVLEEAQNYCPERSFGEAKSSPVIRQVTAEGRKFGMGMCIISQRPSRVDKSVISQVSTQIIMKVTNPHDVKAIGNSIEGITAETENEVKDIPVGTALVTGVIDLPLFFKIRPRRTKHGGEAVNILSMPAKEDAVSDMLLLIQPKISSKDIELMEGIKVKSMISPCLMLLCSQGKDEFNMLVDMNSGKLVTNVETGEGTSFLNLSLEELSPQQGRIFSTALSLGKFKPAELFAKSGVQFSDLYDLIMVLVKKGYLDKEGDTYRISESIKGFSELKKFAFYDKPGFARFEGNAKLDSRYKPEQVKDIISRFAEIKSLKECWLVKYTK
ncbi:MAG: ATP-binding protein [Candidatus Nanoarchaeia archaeon]|nr:ATP-binding protein [Candidatus Nanoarchaeia archaeon]